MAFTEQIFYDTNDDGTTNVFGANWDGQTFTTVGAFIISRVSLLIYRVGSPGNVTVSIRATDAGLLPTGADLCSATISGNGLTTDTAGAWTDFDFGVPASLSATTLYAIVIAVPSGNASNKITWRTDTSSPLYTGGRRVFSTNSGVAWSGGTYDNMFRTYSGSGTVEVELAASGSITLAGTANLTYAENVAIAASGSITISGTATLTYTVAASGDYTYRHETKKVIVAGSDAIWISS